MFVLSKASHLQFLGGEATLPLCALLAGNAYNLAPLYLATGIRTAPPGLTLGEDR